MSILQWKGQDCQGQRSTSGVEAPDGGKGWKAFDKLIAPCRLHPLGPLILHIHIVLGRTNNTYIVHRNH